MTCTFSTYVGAPCAGCHEYQQKGMHIVEDGDERSLWCKTCCPRCNAPDRAELTGSVGTVAGTQGTLWGAADGE